MSLPFEIIGGSVTGVEHTRLGRPNQDAWRISRRDDLLVGIVCDGCGDATSPHSEVGAQLAAHFLTTGDWSTNGYTLQHAMRNGLLNNIGEIAIHFRNEITRPERGMARVVQDVLREFFLFTILGFIIDSEKSLFFGLGDGVLIINGKPITLGPYPGNAPPYLAYALMESNLLTHDPGCLDFQIHAELPTRELENFLIGSDGAQQIEVRQKDLMPALTAEPLGPLSQFWEQERFFRNPQYLARRLLQANRPYQEIDWEKHEVHHRPGLLSDDTTLVVGQRKEL